MKIKEIGTLAAAGALSLAAVLLLDQQVKSTAPAPEGDALVVFEDSSPLLPVPSPVPTAEPPDREEAAGTDTDGAAEHSDAEEGEEPLQLSLAAADPVPAPSADDGSPPRDSAEGAAELFEDPIFEAPVAGAQASLAGIEIDPAPEIAEDEPDGIPGFAEAAGEASPAPSGDGAGQAPASIIEETPTGFWLREARLNDVFQHLSQLANLQYFHNAELEGPNYIVTGQLMDDDPVVQMEELALMYGITIHRKGNTVYAFTSAQLSRLPTEPFRYQLKYLRPSDIEQIKLILQPFLTPGSGIIEYETKTNTLIVMDNTRQLDALALFLDQIDQPKQQIAIETRILRITSSSRNRIGVDWSSVLGENGTSISMATSLNNLFNLPELDTVANFVTTVGTGNSLAVVESSGLFRSSTPGDPANDGSNLVLSPLQLTAVVRALNAGGLAQQESSPTLIAEDNEEGLISIIDRIPIVTSTFSETTAGQSSSEEVRYRIDQDDPVGDPATTREVGVSVSVTPTILPDETIRMSLRPRSAQVVEFVQSPSGNLYPRVNESTVTTTARVPNGHSLLIGGFYEEIQTEHTNKVPLLGDIPAVNLLFKSTDTVKEHTSLVFIVTPRLYRPNVPVESDLVSYEIHDSHILPTDHDYPDRRNPGSNYRSNLRDTGANLFRRYEPDPPSNLLHPEHPYNLPQAQPVHGKPERGQQFGQQPSVTVRSAGHDRRPGSLLGRMFGGNQRDNRR